MKILALETEFQMNKKGSFNDLNANQNVSIDSPVETSKAVFRDVTGGTQPEHSRALVQDITTECRQGHCKAVLSLTVQRPGTSEGALLMILEAEVPRIGPPTTLGAVRKRYFIYPGGIVKDSLDTAGLDTLEHKRFYFTRSLETVAQFNIGKLNSPLAINVYIYDNEKRLVHHERHALEAEP